MQGIVNLVKASAGLAVIPQYMISNDIKSGKLKVIRPNNKAVINEIGLVQLADKVPSLAEKAFVRHILKEKVNFENYHP